MQGREFWILFNGAQIPDEDLAALGENIGYKSDDLSNGGYAALDKLARAMDKIGVSVPITELFDALKAEMPGIFSRKALLEGLADEYSAKKPYDNLSEFTREYLDGVGRHLPNIVVQPKAPAPTASTKPSTVSKTPTLPASTLPASGPTGPTAASTVPKGLTQTEWNFLKAIVGKLSAGEGHKVSANHLASARNLAARANLQIVQLLDAEIASRGDGAQDPDGTPAASQPQSDGAGGVRVGMGPVIGIIAFLFFFVFKR